MLKFTESFNKYSDFKSVIVTVGTWLIFLVKSIVSPIYIVLLLLIVART